MAEENKGLFRTVKDWTGQWLKKLDRALDGVEAVHEEAKALTAYMERMQAMWDEGLVDAAKRAQNETAAQEGGEVEYEIREIENTGMYYVQADRQVIYGNDPEIWADQLTNHINRNIRQGRDVALNLPDGSVLLLTSETAGKAAFRNVVYERGRQRVLTDDEYEAKLNAEAHIDELVAISHDRNPGKPNEPDYKNIHGQLAVDGWRYRRAFFMDFDGKYYELTVSVAIGRDRKTVYNVANMRERAFPTIPGSSDHDNRRTGENSFSADSIRDSKEKSNSEFQERDYMPTDRELLLEAATDARASDELRAYARKQKTLEALERKMRRQQEALEAAESGPEAEEGETDENGPPRFR